MAKTFVGVYDKPETAGRVVDDLVRAGVERETLSSFAPALGPRLATSELAGQDYTHIDGVGDVRAQGPLRARISGHTPDKPAGGLIEALVDWGLSPGDAQTCADALRHGDSLVVAKVGDDLSAAVEDVMKRHQAPPPPH